MPNFQGTSRAQSNFLRAFRTDPFGPPVEKWPSPAILRRWLRRPGFVQAMRSIRDAMRYQADFQLLAAAASASHAMHSSVSTSDRALETAQLNAMSSLMKLAHLRQRFAPEEPAPPVRSTPASAGGDKPCDVLEELVCVGNPKATIETVLSMHRHYTGRDIRADFHARMQADREAGMRRERLVERPLWYGHRTSQEVAEMVARAAAEGRQVTDVDDEGE